MSFDTDAQKIGQKIHLIRGLRVMLDRDLAELYQVETKALNQAVRRNLDRFPADFMFQLNPPRLSVPSTHDVIVATVTEDGRGGTAVVVNTISH